jgi:UDP-N-acetylmuramoyl-L-alanyl-D-glutamate--2,6-diaminopimelate ligase
MRLGALIGGDDDSAVTGFAIDHRKVAPGHRVRRLSRHPVFNGEDFVPTQCGGAQSPWSRGPGSRRRGRGPCTPPRSRAASSPARRPFFKPFPGTVVAVTGTNGKTSNVELTRQLWRMSGHHAASIGTLGVTTADDQVTTGLTTPDIVTFLSNMAGLAREGVTHAAFEASSHGLSQYRTEGLPVQAAAFTNFSRDHLDYHGTMEAYFEAKMRLFSEVLEADGTAVIWADDPKSEEVARRCEARGIRCLTVGRKGETLRLLGREPSQLGQKLTIEAEGKAAQPHHSADRRLSGRQRDDGRRARAGHRRRACADARESRSGAAGAGPARAGCDHASGRSGLCRLRAYRGRARKRDRGAPAPCEGPPHHRLRRGRGP